MQEVNAITSAVILYRKSNPRELFCEIKDEGYPNPLFRHHLFPFGGAQEAQDSGPRDTLVRELNEELALSNESDNALLRNCVAAISESLVPYKDYLYQIPKAVFDRLIPEKKKGTWTELASFWLAPLEEATWTDLTMLQHTHKNLSTESGTIMVSLDHIVNDGIKVSWELAVVLREFFAEKHIADAEKLPTMSDVLVEAVGVPKKSYGEYEDSFTLSSP